MKCRYKEVGNERDWVERHSSEGTKLKKLLSKGNNFFKCSLYLIWYWYDYIRYIFEFRQKSSILHNPLLKYCCNITSYTEDWALTEGGENDNF